MSWNMDVQYVNANYPYNTTSGSFMEYFEGLTYEHVNFIFSGASHGQDFAYPSVNTSYNKFGLPESGSYSYYENCHHDCEVNSYGQGYYMDRRALGSSPVAVEEETATAASSGAWNGNAVANSNTSSHDGPTVCPRRHQSLQDSQVIWQDNVDPDNMTYEELLELGEAVGTQSRGLSQEHIWMLPVSKYKSGFFFKRKSKERCVICQMEYKRGERQITLPCKHIYHAGCGSRWLSINKACPICYTEVFVDASSSSTPVKKGIQRR